MIKSVVFLDVAPAADRFFIEWESRDAKTLAILDKLLVHIGGTEYDAVRIHGRHFRKIYASGLVQDGDVFESRFAVTRRNRTIHARMRDYLYELTHNDQLNTVILTVGDGMSLSVKL